MWTVGTVGTLIHTIKIISVRSLDKVIYNLESTSKMQIITDLTEKKDKMAYEPRRELVTVEKTYVDINIFRI